ncbi:ABC transporter ATP-binding protein [Falsiroseomonas oryzae]|uniref:ABC transporter ATP-binding protein n=1 Tax=Falsiroseomonas oryzae TaxID=2766473 RepID=UPI0022EADB2E|nr:ABC transporter ATP-binding protein [Roseomonas sp. MO-31]
MSKPTGDVWAELRRLAPLSRQHAWAAPLVVLLGLAAALAESVGVSLVVLLIYQLLGRGADAVGIGGLLGQIYAAAHALAGGSSIALGAMVFSLILGKATLALAYSLVIATARNRISEDLRNQVHAQFLDITFAELGRRDRGVLLNTLATETWKVADAWHAVARIAINLCTVAVFGMLLLAISWQVSAIAAAGSALLWLALRAVSRHAAQLGQAAVAANQQLAARMLATLHGMRTIRAFGGEAAAKARFAQASAEARDAFAGIERLYSLVGPLGEMGSLAVLGLIVTSAVLLDLPTTATLAAIALLHRLNPHLRELEGHGTWLAGTAAALRAVREIVDRSDKTYPPDGHRAFSGSAEDIRFVGVTFAHEGTPLPALRGASFSLPRGGLTTLVGPSGAGKTTVVNLLLRLYEPQAGTILVDGEPLHRLRRAEWLRSIALAGQDSDLIPGSIADNIRMGSPEAGPAELRAAAADAGILGFIEGLPAGFDTDVGDAGLNLSGGQRQRIGLARALVRNPDLLILDEATNAVDVPLESDIRARVRSRLPRATILVITHRLASAVDSDHVVCLVDGRVVEEGPPSRLLALRNGMFRRFLDSSPKVASPAALP